MLSAPFLIILAVYNSGPQAYGFLSGVWSAPMVTRVVAEEFGISYTDRHVRRSHYPEDPVRLPIGLLFHDLVDQPTKRFDAGSGFATAKHLGAPHVPGRHISQRAATLVLKLNAHGFPTLRLGRRPHHMVSGLVQCSYILRPARSLTPFTGAFYTKGFEHFIASMLASAATGWNESCRVGLPLEPSIRVDEDMPRGGLSPCGAFSLRSLLTSEQVSPLRSAPVT